MSLLRHETRLRNNDSDCDSCTECTGTAGFLITGGKFSDNMSGFFIIKKSLLSKRLDKIFYGYGDFYIRLLFYMEKKKLKIHEVPVRYGPRKYGQSKTKFFKILILYSLETVKLVFKNLKI